MRFWSATSPRGVHNKLHLRVMRLSGKANEWREFVMVYETNPELIEVVW